VTDRRWGRKDKSKSSIAISMAFHAVAIAGLMSITFRYPLSDMFSRPDTIQPVPVRYIPLKPQPASGAQAQTTRRATPSAAMPTAASIPVGTPALAQPVSPATSALGAGGSAATAPAGRDPVIGVGIRPGIPDGRLATNPMNVPRAPETEGQKAERAIAAIYQEYLDSARVAMANPGRKPGDWSWGGKDGEKWGWDENGIHVGGITIPNLVLAALPLPMSSGTSPIEVRSQNFMRSDIQMHAGLMSEDEFRQAVRRVRERVDRERRERMEKAAKKKEGACC
jgi:hypothetical protein